MSLGPMGSSLMAESLAPFETSTSEISSSDMSAYGHGGTSYATGALPINLVKPSTGSSTSSSSSSSSSSYTTISSSARELIDSEVTLISGVVGYYEIDTSMAPATRDRAWDSVEVTWSRATNTFTWTNKAGVSWSMTPVSGSGGWDTTQLKLGNDNPYFMDGYTSARMEWVSFNLGRPPVGNPIFYHL